MPKVNKAAIWVKIELPAKRKLEKFSPISLLPTTLPNAIRVLLNQGKCVKVGTLCIWLVSNFYMSLNLLSRRIAVSSLAIVAMVITGLTVYFRVDQRRSARQNQKLLDEIHDFHPITQSDVAALMSAVGNADRVAVFYANYATRAEHQIYVSTNPDDIEALRKSISIAAPHGWFHCACEPSTVIRLFNRDRNIGEIDLFAGSTIRFTNWSSDAEISNTAEWFEWLDRRGIKAPREAFDQGVAEGQKARAAEERWMKAMPSSLVPLWPSVSKESPMGEHETGPFDSALSKQFPDKDARILILMAWFGSGMGPWSGFPVYEGVPQQMLLKYSTPELVAAVSSRTLNEDETEGAARLFAGSRFNESRPQDNASLPAELKRHLLEHSLRSTDEDKRKRAEHWLAPRVQN